MHALSLLSSILAVGSSLLAVSPVESFSPRLAFGQRHRPGTASLVQQRRVPPSATSHNSRQYREHVILAMTSSSSASTGSFELPEDGPPESSGSDNSNGRGISSSELRQVSEARQRRLQEEEERLSRFVFGDDLHKLRQQVLSLRQSLQESRLIGAHERTRELEQAILFAQNLDAEFVYIVALEKASRAAKDGDIASAEQYRKEARYARNALPQFNLDGLWVGKYGSHGFEMVNVTYVGDTLVAYKVTGDQNVPKGEVSFTVDLSLDAAASKGPTVAGGLEPIQLGKKAAAQWGSQYLQRFAGQGQVASKGYRNAQWLEGQLILVSQYFSFAWLPISHQVFFGRPSAELTLKLLRQDRQSGRSPLADDNDAATRQYLERCLEETILLEDEMEINNEGFFASHNQEDYYTQSGCFE
jgi:hypothetical protein